MIRFSALIPKKTIKLKDIDSYRKELTALQNQLKDLDKRLKECSDIKVIQEDRKNISARISELEVKILGLDTSGKVTKCF